jgi:hypothetical protein
MSFNNESYTMIISSDKIQYKKIQQIKYNFRESISIQDLDEGIILNFPYNNSYYSYKSLSDKIPLNRVFRRSGVIPYTYISEEDEKVKYFCMAVDSQYGNLTDFGGGVKKYETFAGAASRELYEESLGVFKISPECIYNCSTAVYDFNNIVMFLNIDLNSTNPSLDSTIQQYHNNLSNVVESETKGIFWIREDKFFELIKSGKSVKFDGFYYPSVYKLVADLLRSVSNINEII